jgi:hypothetical protein
VHERRPHLRAVLGHLRGRFRGWVEEEDVLVGEGHALGHPGGPRRVEDLGQVARLGGHLHWAFTAVAGALQVGQIGDPTPGLTRDQVGRAHDSGGLAVLEDGGHLGAGEARPQRHGRRACLQNGHVGDGVVGPPGVVVQEGDPVTVAGTTVGE